MTYHHRYGEGDRDVRGDDHDHDLYGGDVYGDDDRDMHGGVGVRYYQLAGDRDADDDHVHDVHSDHYDRDVNGDHVNGDDHVLLRVP